MADKEVAIEGWDAIGGMFGVSGRTMQRRRDELVACGAIFYRRMPRGGHRVVCAFPSMLKIWIARKTASGEDL